MQLENTNNIQTFNFNGIQLRALLIEDEPWFIAMDVASALDYQDAWSMTRRLDEDEIQNLQIGGFGNRGVKALNESGLYSSILGSNKPEAKAFKKWVTSEVLPQIRKTGSYNPPVKELTIEEQLANAVLLSREIIEAKDAKIAELEPKGNRHDAFLDSDRQFSISNVAKAYKAAGIKIGREGLNRTLETLGMVYDSYRGEKKKHVWRVKTQAQRDGYLVEVERSNEDHTSYAVKITPKGFFHIYETLADLQEVETYTPRETLADLLDK